MGVDETAVITVAIVYYGTDYPQPPEDLEDYELNQYVLQDAYESEGPMVFAVNPESLNIETRFHSRHKTTSWSLTPFDENVYDIKKIIDEYKAYVLSQVYNREDGCYEQDKPKISKYLDELGSFLLTKYISEEKLVFSKKSVLYGKFLFRYFR